MARRRFVVTTATLYATVAGRGVGSRGMGWGFLANRTSGKCETLTESTSDEPTTVSYRDECGTGHAASANASARPDQSLKPRGVSLRVSNWRHNQAKTGSQAQRVPPQSV